MALFRVSNNRAQFDAAGNEASDQYGAGIRFTQGGNARVTTGSPTNYNQGIPMSATGQVAIVDATAGLPAGTIFHNGLPMSGDKVCVSRNATAVVSNGTPYDSAGAVAADINLDLNFIGTDTLNSSVTFTRASSATFVGSNGLIQSATTNTPRFDYDPVTLAAKGLLIEEQRTNLLTYSDQFDNVVWSRTGSVSITANSDTAPDGSITADRFVSTGGAFPQIAQAVTLAAGDYTLSMWVRSDGTSQIAQALILDGTAVSFTPTATWTRITVTKTGVLAGSRTAVVATNSGTAPASSFYIWGAQLEAGSFATSYIPTVASQVTRSADVASVNTLSPWFNASAGTLYGEYAPYSTLSGTITALNDGTFNNRIYMYLGGGVANPTMLVMVGGVSQALITNPVVSANVVSKTASAYATNNFAIATNAGTVTTAGAGSLPTGLNKLDLGQYLGVSSLNGWLRRITYYPRRLSNAELQAITA